MKKITAVVLTIVIVLIMLSACSLKGKEPSKDQNAAPSSSTTQNGQTNQGGTPDGKVASKENTVIEATGIYNGQVDTTFVEIKLDGESSPREFSILEIMDSFKGFQPRDKVKLKYTVDKDNQRMLKSIEKAN